MKNLQKEIINYEPHNAVTDGGDGYKFYKRIAEVANVEFAAVGKDLKGILIGGPGPTKETFVNGPHLHNELKKKIVAIKDIAYTDEQGLHELVEKSQDALAEAEIMKEKNLVNEFFNKVNDKKDIYKGEVITTLLHQGWDRQAIEPYVVAYYR